MAAGDVVGLLSAIGGDTAGALSIGQPGRTASVQWLVSFVIIRPVLGWTSNWAPLIEAAVGTAIVAFLSFGRVGAPGRAFDLGVARFFGRVSYSFYLLHPQSQRWPSSLRWLFMHSRDNGQVIHRLIWALCRRDEGRPYHQEVARSSQGCIGSIAQIYGFEGCHRIIRGFK